MIDLLPALWTLLAANLAMAAGMAFVVAAAGMLPLVRQSPRLRHALWLLVVAKLLTPPVVEFPVLPLISFESGLNAPEGDSIAQREIQPRWADGEQPTSPLALEDSSTQSVATNPASVFESTLAAPKSIIAENRAQQSESFAWIVLGGIVGLPTIFVLARSLRQMRRVARLLDQAPAADERVGCIGTRAARRMGMTTRLEIRIVAGRLMPLLWVRRGLPVVVLPVTLVDRFDDDQIECIVCHELAHFIRRDHWSNAFVLGVAALYWWFPVVWWARRELLAAQEQCCDELVIVTAGMSRRRYAETLFETVDFITNERLLLPVLASGFLRASALRRRIEMLASQEVAPRIPVLAAGLVLLMTAAFFCLPVSGQGPREARDDEHAKAANGPALTEPSRPHRGTFAVLSVVEKVELKMQLSPGNQVKRVPVLGDLQLVGPLFAMNAAGRAENRTAHVAIDPRKHCLYIGQSPPSGQGALRVDLERGVTYTVSAAGAAYMSDQTGVDADPFPGVVFYYSTGEEDGYAVRYVILKPGESVRFKTPWLISPDDEVFAAAFFLDAWPDSDNRGSYTLTFERAEEVASRNDTTPSLSAADDSDRERETPSNSGGAEPATGDPLSKIPLIKRLLANPRQPAE